jgi:hypothetical protein
VRAQHKERLLQGEVNNLGCRVQDVMVKVVAHTGQTLDLVFGIKSLLSALCSLLSALCSLLSALCSLLSALSALYSLLSVLPQCNISPAGHIHTGGW